MADMAYVRDVAERADFLGVIATARPDGRVHASLVKAGVLDDPETGEPAVGVVVAGGARKLAILRRSGRASVVFHDGWRWAAVEGPARLEGPDDPSSTSPERPVAPTLRAVFAAAGGTHGDWAAFDRVMADERRCAVFVGAAVITGNG